MRERTRARLVRVGAVAAALSGLFIVAPEIFTATFSDFETFARVAALVIALAVWVVLVRQFVGHRRVRLALTAIPILVVGWVSLWPYLRPPTSVDEAFPTVVVAAPEPAAELSGEPADAVQSEATSTTTTTTASVNPTTSPLPLSTTTTTATTTTTTAVPAGPFELRRSGFQGLTGHNGSGDAGLYRLEDDSILLRFESVNIGPGPALFVWLVPGADQRSTGGGTYVAPLAAEQGNQNYTVPAGVDITEGTWTVLVWCDTYSVEVANATFS